MNRERLDEWFGKAIIGLILVILGIGPLAIGAVRTQEFLVLQLLVIAVTCLWLFRIWVNPNTRLLWPPVCWAVVAFVAYAVVRYLQADIEHVARQELIRIVLYAVLFFVVLNNGSRQESVQIICYGLIVTGTLISMYAVYQFATHSDRVWNLIRPTLYNPRGSGTYMNPNHLAGLLEMLLPLSLAYVLAGRVGHLPRVFLGYAALVMLAGIGVTLSRGGWVAVAVSLLFFIVMVIRKSQYRIPALILLVVLTAAAAIFYSKTYLAQRRIDQAFTLGDSVDVHSRLWLWEPAWKMWQERPLTGVGPGHFDYRFPAFRPTVVQSRPGYVHNDYLNCLTDWGVVGMVLVIGTLVLVFTGISKTWKFCFPQEGSLNTKPSNRAAFILGGTTALIAILAHSFFDFNMQIPANAIVVVTLMALLSGFMRFASERYWLRLNTAGKIVATLVVALGITYLTLQGTRKAREYRWLSQARHETSVGAQYEALKKAVAIEPSNFETTYTIGELLRSASWQAKPGFESLAAEAIEWFKRGMVLNSYDAYNHLRIGMCLDWLGRHEAAAPYYEKALKLDPNNYYLVAHQGWHFVQAGDFEKAKFWFKRSWSMNWWDNPIAANYLLIVERKLKENPPPK